MNPTTNIHARIHACEQEMAWQPLDPEGNTYWQVRLLSELAERTGLPRCQSDLEPQVVNVTQLDGYRREEIVFQSRPGLYVNAYMLIPDGLREPQPAVLCLHGHGRGVDEVVGIAEDGSQRLLGERGEYQADFALQCVEHGFPALAIEQFSFGRRSTNGPGTFSCHENSVAALMMGETMVGWRVWDAMRGIDYLETRPEVDRERICTMGISGGGLSSLFTAAFDTRVFAAVVSGYFNTFRSSILSVHHCVDNYVPGLLTLIEMPDLAGLIAPRRLFVESGRDDDIFPIEAFRQAVDRAREIFAAERCPGHFGAAEFDGDHHFDGREAFATLSGWLAAGFVA